MLLDHANQTFDQCIKCTVCTAYCPVAKANPAYPGPKQAGPDGERLRIKSPELFDSEDWRNAYAVTAQAVLSKPLIRVDVPAMSISY